MTNPLYPTRRRALTLASASAASLALPGWALAQSSEPIKIAALLPLTGGGGAYGPSMQRAAELVVNEVNAAGGVLGRKVQLLTEDDQTNPDAAVRAARKLIDADKVCAIVGTWASSVTTAVAPLCWENILPTCHIRATSFVPSQHRLCWVGFLQTLSTRKVARKPFSSGRKRHFRSHMVMPSSSK